ncbi:MAG: hypothetical protein A4E53_02490 [Pelotomaculum sp. PtaB.Bin104]|nr:MAG: hypothetical protein A4E53_02490 [Pelotomaculum sp. PtaB.Bin104]
MAIPLVMGGKILRQNMKKALFPLELLLSEIRQADAPNLAEVEEDYNSPCNFLLYRGNSLINIPVLVSLIYDCRNKRRSEK